MSKKHPTSKFIVPGSAEDFTFGLCVPQGTQEPHVFFCVAGKWKGIAIPAKWFPEMNEEVNRMAEQHLRLPTGESIQ